MRRRIRWPMGCVFSSPSTSESHKKPSSSDNNSHRRWRRSAQEHALTDLGLGMGQLRKRGGMLITGRESSLAWLGTSRAGRRGLWRSPTALSKIGLLGVVLNLHFFSSKPSFQFMVSKKDHIFYVNNVVLLWLAWILLRYFIVMSFLIVNAWRMSVIWGL